MNVQKKLQELIRIYGANCIYCGKVPANTIDHIVPQSSGWGKSSLQNMLPACKLCNTRKRNSDIFNYANSQQINQIDSIRLHHNISSLQNLKEQYLTWRGAHMAESIFAIKLSQTGKMSGTTDNSLYNRLRPLIGLYLVMVDNRQLEKAKEILTTIFTSNDYDGLYNQYSVSNLDDINKFIRNKKRVDIVVMLRNIYQDFSNNKVTTSGNNILVKSNNDSILDQIEVKYAEPEEQTDATTDDSSLEYLNNTITEINQVTTVIKTLRTLEKERVAVEQQIAHYQKIKARIDVEYQNVINSMEELGENELFSVIFKRLKTSVSK